MTVTAPPRPPHPNDPLELQEIEDLEALIEEAHERARRRRRLYAALALALALAGLGSYLGLSAGGAAPSASVSSQQPSQLLTPGPPTNGLEVWFIRGSGPNGGGPCCSVFPTWRTADQLGLSAGGDDSSEPDAHLVEALVRALIAGPSADEAAAMNWGNVMHPGTHLLGVSVEDGIVTIDIASRLDPVTGATADDPYLSDWYPDGSFSYETGSGLVPLHRVSQLVFTVTQLPSVRGVQFKLDGQPVKVRVEDESGFGVVGAALDRPVTRDDYPINNGPRWAATGQS